MRRSNLETGWYLDEEDRSLLGFTLGFDFCAEHEHEVPRLRRKFGIPDGLPEGLKDRKIRQVPDELTFVEFTLKPKDKRRRSFECALLTTVPSIVSEVRRGCYLMFWSDPHEKWHRPEHDIACAWSDSDFAILVRGEENLQHLRELNDAFRRLDILFGAVVANWVQRRGLTFMLDSRVTDDVRENVLLADLKHKRLIELVKTSGIEERLRAAGKHWFALVPSWADEAETSIRFWLNPVDQRRYRAGWFTPEDLEDWVHDRGRVLKAAPAAA